MGDFGSFSGAEAKGASAQAFFEANGRCNPVCAANGMPMAFVAKRFSTVAKRLCGFLALAKQRVMGKDPARVAQAGAHQGWAQPRSDAWNHRQPVCEDGAKRGQRGYDGGKKTKGRKRHMAVDVMGNVLAVAIHSAGISESRSAHLGLIRLFVALLHLLKILVDGGYQQGVIDWGKSMFGYVLEVVKRPELHKFKVLLKRWIVERTCDWFNGYRRLSKDYEHNPKTSEAMIHFLASNLILKRLATL